jgi:hypothetical protein
MKIKINSDYAVVDGERFELHSETSKNIRRVFSFGPRIKNSIDLNVSLHCKSGMARAIRCGTIKGIIRLNDVEIYTIGGETYSPILLCRSGLMRSFGRVPNNIYVSEVPKIYASKPKPLTFD